MILAWDDMNPEDQYLAGYNIYRKEAQDTFARINPSLLLFNTNTLYGYRC